MNLEHRRTIARSSVKNLEDNQNNIEDGQNKPGRIQTITFTLFCREQLGLGRRGPEDDMDGPEEDDLNFVEDDRDGHDDDVFLVEYSQPEAGIQNRRSQRIWQRWMTHG